jgi:hypothetical protein
MDIRRLQITKATLLIVCTMLFLVHQSDSNASVPPDTQYVFVGEITDTTPPTGTLRPKAGTVTVHVDQVLHPLPPADIANSAGTSIAMRRAQPDAPARGERATFYTEIISFGKIMEVQEVKHVIIPATASAASEEDQVSKMKKAELARNVQEATVVLAGKVMFVSQPPAAAGAEEGQMSEHDPQWRDAVVQVDNVIKGRVANKEITVRFPASTDVAWYKSPKLKEGQQAVFILGEDGATLGHANAAAGEAPPAITRPNSVLPITSLSEIRAAKKPKKHVASEPN